MGSMLNIAPILLKPWVSKFAVFEEMEKTLLFK